MPSHIRKNLFDDLCLFSEDLKQTDTRTASSPEYSCTHYLWYNRYSVCVSSCSFNISFLTTPNNREKGYQKTKILPLMSKRANAKPTPQHLFLVLLRICIWNLRNMNNSSRSWNLSFYGCAILYVSF